MDTIKLPPFAPQLMESTRAMGYNLQDAVADIIDNSITAQCRNVYVRYYANVTGYIAILDDGIGMSSDEITNAMRYGGNATLFNERQAEDLGRFGLGLKTASLSQCRVLTVASVKDGELSVRRWDLDYVIETGEWSLLKLYPEEIEGEPLFDELQKMESGTLVIWKSLDRLGEGNVSFAKGFEDSMDVVKEHLKLVFHRYIAGEVGLQKLAIWMNNDKLTAIDPFLSKDSFMPMATEIIDVNGSPVHITPYILPHLSKMKKRQLDEAGGKDGLRENQGFYIYRNKRLISYGSWYRLAKKTEISKLARVRVDIPNTLDHEWTLDVKKSIVKPPESVKSALSRVIARIIGASEKTFRFRGKKEVDDEKSRIWNRLTGRDVVYYEINRKNQFIYSLAEEFGDEARKKMEMVFRLIEQNIPINSILVDLGGDEDVKQGYTDDENGVEDLMRNLALMMKTTGIGHKEAIEVGRIMEPFKSHEKTFERILQEVFYNE